MSNIFKFIGNERGDSICEEADGCPTEMAVLKRYWRETQATKNEVNSTEEVDNLTEMLISASVPYEDSQGMQLSLVGRVKWYLNFNTNKLREQVEKLTKERDIKEHCITQFELEDLRMKEQLAALAEQNEKQRAFLEFAWKDIPMNEYAFKILEHTMNLPSLASPVLNRIKGNK